MPPLGFLVLETDTIPEKSLAAYGVACAALLTQHAVTSAVISTFGSFLTFATSLADVADVRKAPIRPLP